MKDVKQISGNTKLKIFANAFWMLFDKVFLLLLNFIITVSIANHYGNQEYGSYEYAVSIIAILEILVTFVDGRIVKKLYSHFDGDLVVYNATICRVLFSLICSIIGLIYIFLCGRGTIYSIMFTILLINAIITNLGFGMCNRFEYLLESRKTVIAKDVSALIGGILQLLAVANNFSLISITVIVLVTSVINLIIIVVQYALEFGFKHGKVDINVINQMIRQSLPLAIAASCATIYTKSDSVMLGAMINDSKVGIYAIAVKLVTVVRIALGPICESLFPSFINLYGSNREEYGHLYIKVTSILTWICIIGVSFSFFVLPTIFRFISKDYAQSISVYKILSISCLFMYNAGLRAGHYTLIGRGDILMKAQILSVFLNIILNFVGIHLFGIYGAALATVITQFFSLFFSNFFFGRDGRQVLEWQLLAFNPIRAFK